eukprot:NODE_2212_length_743_cov_697.306916_g1654_i1.p2 GENE.NODE_2212_length_743_cov_697.306916_g1654_i1~~NODE_2212_length_743_cov_697.306916_g1654_i1.p2  ORF type:complete len:170 (-),score=68.17 NODE_2212_length_743_cov_697.306916_g1654_i1:175-684(-)
MLIFKDILSESQDEILTDAYPLRDDGTIIEVDGKYIKMDAENDFDIGGNASAEEAAEEMESTSAQVINIVHFNKLVETSYDKKGYMASIKAYMAKVKAQLEASNPDRVAGFQKGAQEFVKKVLGDFNNYCFYTGENMDANGMVVLCKFSDDGMSQVFYYWKDGMKEEKC